MADAMRPHLVRVLPHWLTTQSQSISADVPDVRLCSASFFNLSVSSSAHAPDALPTLAVFILMVAVIPPGLGVVY